MEPFRRVIGISLLLALIGLAAAVAYPLTVVDDLGREVVLDEEPRRIVSMIPSSTETVCALGACDLLVGVDQFSNHPQAVASLPRLGSAFSPNIEALVALEPDLVLADEYSGIAGMLEELGITVYAGTPQTLEETFESFETLGRLLDRETEAALLRGRLLGEIEEVQRRVSELPSPSVYFEVDATPYSVGPGSYVDELIALAGGENIIGEGFAQFPQVDPEYIVAQDPDVIVLADAPFGVTSGSLAARPGWSSIDAVRDGRVMELTSEQVDAVSRAGPRVAEAVRLLAAFFHPDVL
ncbi:MAG TPA: ABC transporter substrate-binding protein [Trueperaceae bacterium]